jgi:hypothetical protein
MIDLICNQIIAERVRSGRTTADLLAEIVGRFGFQLASSTTDIEKIAAELGIELAP